MPSPKDRLSANRAHMLPAGYVVFNAFGHAQFAWHDERTGCFYSEIDGARLTDVIAATAWFSDTVH